MKTLKKKTSDLNFKEENYDIFSEKINFKLDMAEAENSGLKEIAMETVQK